MHHLQSVDSVADPEEGPRSPLFLSQTLAQMAEKNLMTRVPPPPLSEGLDCHWIDLGLQHGFDKFLHSCNAEVKINFQS